MAVGPVKGSGGVDGSGSVDNGPAITPADRRLAEFRELGASAAVRNAAARSGGTMQGFSTAYINQLADGMNLRGAQRERFVSWMSAQVESGQVGAFPQGMGPTLQRADKNT